MKSVGRGLPIGIEMYFHPESQVSSGLGEGKSLSTFDLLGVLRVSSESHLYRDERVVKKELALCILWRQQLL